MENSAPNKPTRSNKKMQEDFIEHYARTRNGVQSAIAAGYSPASAAVSASRLLKKDNILSRVRELQKELADQMCITNDFVLLRLMDTYEKCMAVQPVTAWDPESRRKVPRGEYMFDAKGALRALELIGRHLGMFEDKVSVDAKVKTDKLAAILSQLEEPQDG